MDDDAEPLHRGRQADREAGRLHARAVRRAHGRQRAAEPDPVAQLVALEQPRVVLGVAHGAAVREVAMQPVELHLVVATDSEPPFRKSHSMPSAAHTRPTSSTVS